MDKENDLFSESIRDKLVNYSLPVDNDSWEKIANRVNPPFRKRMFLKRLAAITVAASIALLFLVFTINKKTVHYETANQLSGHEKEIIQDVPEREIVQPVQQQNVENSAVVRKSQLHERLAENNHTTEVTFTKEVIEEEKHISQEKEQNVQEKKSVQINPYFDFNNEMQQPSIKRKKRQSIRLSFGSGGALLAENNINQGIPNLEMPYFRASAEVVSNSKTEEILLNEKYTGVSHHLPLSFGITLKKELNRTFAIESGIVYSYLETSFSKESYPVNKANRQLHYIGVPLNIHTRLYGNRFSRWDIYLSTGGMVEKGILSHFVQVTDYENHIAERVTIVSNEKINGLQWSVGISPGVDFQLQKNYSIYFEPKVSYFFDNNQPESARTKHPIVVGLNAGVRYMW